MANQFSGREARLLLRHARTAALATVNRGNGIPYGSIVNLATTPEGNPFIFISRLAWHTQNLLADGRGSLLVSALPASGDALTGPRATVLGHFEPAEASLLRARYLAHHPQARLYLDFADFSFWTLIPDTIHAVAGFGRIETMAPGEVFLPQTDAGLFDSARDHVNDDHAGAVELMAERLLHAGPGRWRVAAVDPDGFHISDGEASLRLDFDATVSDAAALRLAFAALAGKARAA